MEYADIAKYHTWLKEKEKYLEEMGEEYQTWTDLLCWNNGCAGNPSSGCEWCPAYPL